MGAMLHALHEHQPLPTWAPPPAAPSAPYITTTPQRQSPPAHKQYTVPLHGALFFVTYSSDEDGAWVDLIQLGGLWWEVEQVHRQEWIAALNDALCEQLLAEAREGEQP